MSDAPIRALCWSEVTEPADVYPNGINGAVAAALEEIGLKATVTQLSDPEQGLTEAALENADVLFWFGHKKHKDVSDESVSRVLRHVLARGMGFVPLHSSHYCLPFKELMGTRCGFNGVREVGESERVFVTAPDHPIAQGIDKSFTVPKEEMYCEPFQIPNPDEVVFIGSFGQGEVFRAGCCWERGLGRVFYFQPGHETYPIYFQDEIKRILQNAAGWAARKSG